MPLQSQLATLNFNNFIGDDIMYFMSYEYLDESGDYYCTSYEAEEYDTIEELAEDIVHKTKYTSEFKIENIGKIKDLDSNDEILLKNAMNESEFKLNEKIKAAKEKRKEENKKREKRAAEEEKILYLRLKKKFEEN